LRDGLVEAKTDAARFAILERSLLARAVRPLARHRAVALALREFEVVPHVRTISEVTRRAGLSARRFIEAFTDEVGLTPKLYCRVRRFQEVVRRVAQGRRRVKWVELALDCGYYDQAHFVADFRAFSGLCPTAYVDVMGEHVNHVPLGE
jgi:AraC-like DNA-binding protein